MFRPIILLCFVRKTSLFEIHVEREEGYSYPSLLAVTVFAENSSIFFILQVRDGMVSATGCIKSGGRDRKVSFMRAVNEKIKLMS